MEKMIEFILSVFFTAGCIAKILAEHICLIIKFIIKGYIQATKITYSRFDELEKRSKK